MVFLLNLGAVGASQGKRRLADFPGEVGQSWSCGYWLGMGRHTSTQRWGGPMHIVGAPPHEGTGGL